MKTRLLKLAALAVAWTVFAPRADAQSSLDFGDAPAPYPTRLAQNGARHTATGVRLGTLVDTENDGLANSFALGDDLAASDDEDGVVFVSLLVPGQTATVQVTVSQTALLNAWLDFNRDGDWADPGEQIFTNRAVATGLNTLTFAVPAVAQIGATFARFRVNAQAGLSFVGAAPEGEVEDYQVGVSEPMDFGDAPTGGQFFFYPTLLSQNGARHRIIPNFMLGARVDSEPDGQPNAIATGDDINPTAADDEDGIVFTGALTAGQLATVQVTCTMSAGQTGRVDAWVDFNADGDWNDAGEQIFTDLPVQNGGTNVSFSVPGSAPGGPTFARFRLSVNGKLRPEGSAANGEVEDYQVNITAALDYADAPSPYPTLLAQNGARHNYTNDFCLGTKVDGEVNGQPDATATGDDVNPSTSDDEDGVIFTSGIVPGQSANVQVFVTGFSAAGGPVGVLNAWLDFNRDGDWADPGEQIFANIPVLAGVNSLSFAVPAAAVEGITFARFRLNRQGGLSYTGLSPDGEVEDYQVNISPEFDFGDAPPPYPTLLAANGARHDYVRSIHLGPLVDSEPDGQPDAASTGDDLNPPGADDEDGVVFTSPLVPGTLVGVQVSASVPGLLHAWIDFDANGSWADASEKIFSGTGLAAGVNNLSFAVPATAKLGQTFARFRFTTQTALVDFVGRVPDGEVEDYRVSIIPDRERCDLACVGRDFWLTFPGNYAPDTNNPVRPELCFIGPVGVSVNVSIPGLGFTTNVIVPASNKTGVRLPVAADLADLNDAITNRGIHVTATSEVRVYGFNLVHYTSDSYLALPSAVLGTEYVVLGYGNTHVGVPPLNGTQFAIVACESNTLVRITPSVDTGGHLAGIPYIITLQPGECYQLRNTGDAPNDLSGTLIKSDKPVAVFGGHQVANVPSSTGWFADHLVEHLLPVNTWGNDFYTAPLATRTGGDTFRILAGYDSTTVFLNGAPIGTIDKGKFLQLSLAAGAHIQADRPVLVAQYANSADFDPPAGSFSQGDPFMVQVPATRHYIQSYVICTATNDFPANYANIVVPTASAGTIQIDGVAVGVANFTAIAGTGYSYARRPVNGGRHSVTGGVPFGLTVYGWDVYESYGHPACLFFGDVAPPNITGASGPTTASVEDYPNTPGFVPAPDYGKDSTVQDNCSPQLPRPTQTPRPGVLVPPGVHTVTLSVQDDNGNVGETNITFTVIDPSPVTIECPSNIVVNCTGPSGAIVNFVVKAYTTYDPNVPVVSTPPSGSLFPPGTTEVRSTATSLAGLSANCSFFVTVNCQGGIMAEPGGNGLTLSWTGSPGTLESAPTVNGPWRTVVSGVNFYIAPISTLSNAFFRVRY